MLKKNAYLRLSSILYTFYITQLLLYIHTACEEIGVCIIHDFIASEEGSQEKKRKKIKYPKNDYDKQKTTGKEIV